MSVPVLTIVTNALVGISVYGAGEPIKAADGVYVLGQLNTILDNWGANPQASVAEVFTTFTTTPSLNPHTIGPTGTWVLPVRPAKIDGLAWLSSGIATRIDVHDDADWYLTQTVLNPGVPTDAYYSADVPNGSLYLTGLPAAATSIIVMTRTALAAVLLTASITLAPGYQDALERTLMEAIVDGFHMTLTANQIRLAGVARGLIFAGNLRIPSLSCAGVGLPATAGTTWWDTTSGMWR